ncbi:hypothetical protein GUITHDRAFT_107219 [Guillardia theta CCMP2712]|uniref:SH3 domain-containing protein n=1 Tax=Guillardia theta (strain CCMP2712) TaxID=905079 RepID=L1JFF4_GUITC|nr:hypothetical protein GUITHDRAFT_107219 [Guillardia theta CCMP2712]EKX46864.1 hypothetical protein GUITHDRAFT_107219 [Guillardia theta CCMP2712]|eukprot:XP_005833844.1 hypothetical protein GUITHDRAFT_107219 [Guillardia theta CCMP2712]
MERDSAYDAGRKSRITMSDSDEHHAAPEAGAVKKDLIYKMKAFKRRTLHSVQKVVGKVQETKDIEFDELFEKFLDVSARMEKLNRSAHRYMETQMKFLQSGYDNDPQLKRIAMDFDSSHETLVSSVGPRLQDRWLSSIVEPLDKVVERFKEIKNDAERRKRYLADYDHYRLKKKGLEDDAKKEKNQEKLRECEEKLSAAQAKYFTMNEKLTIRLRAAEYNKTALLNDPLLAAISVQHDLFSQGNADFEVLYTKSKEPNVAEAFQACSAEAEELAQIDSQLRSISLSSVNHRERNSFDHPPQSHGFASTSEQHRGFEDDFNKPTPSNFNDNTFGMFEDARSLDPSPHVQALFAYEAAAEIELSLEENDIIEVLREDDSGWWQGRKDGRVGWFPFNYVEII